MAHASPDLNVTPNYEEIIAIDVAASLAATETLTSIVSTTLSVIAGTDANPASRLYGTPAIVNSTQCAVGIQNMIAGVTYLLVFVVTSTLNGVVSQWDASVNIVCQAPA